MSKYSSMMCACAWLFIRVLGVWLGTEMIISECLVIQLYHNVHVHYCCMYIHMCVRTCTYTVHVVHVCVCTLSTQCVKNEYNYLIQVLKFLQMLKIFKKP